MAFTLVPVCREDSSLHFGFEKKYDEHRCIVVRIPFLPTAHRSGGEALGGELGAGAGPAKLVEYLG